MNSHEIGTDPVKMIQNTHGQMIALKPVDGQFDTGELDPRVRAHCESEQTIDAGKTTQSIEELRAAMGWPNTDVTHGRVVCTRASFAGRNGEIPVRIYHNKNQKIRSALIYVHGGGFIGGSLDCSENPCRCLAYYSDATIISVGYRLAPEEPFPKGVEDVMDVVDTVFLHASEYQIDPTRIGISGESAGATLATVCARKDAENGGRKIRFQVLIYPVVQLGGEAKDVFVWDEREYRVREQSGHIWSAIHSPKLDREQVIQWYLAGSADLLIHPDVSPLLAKSFTGMPPTLLINAEYDYLRLEGEAYARLLERAGTPVSMIRYGGMDHAFIDKIGLYPQAEDAMKEIAKWIFTCW